MGKDGQREGLKREMGGCLKDKCVFVCMCVHMGAGVDQQDGWSHVERERKIKARV